MRKFFFLILFFVFGYAWAGVEFPAKPVPPRLVNDFTNTLAPDDIQAVCRAIAGRPGVIVCGELPEDVDFPQAICSLAAQLDCPILAEPLSNLRFGQHDLSHVAVRYNAWLNDSGSHARVRPEWVLRFGAFPVTRNLQNYTASASVQIVVQPWPRWSDPAQRITHMLRADPTAFCTALVAALPSVPTAT